VHLGSRTDNSILVVQFRHPKRMKRGRLTHLAAAADRGIQPVAPVMMTAGEMIMGMITLALGVGEGGGAEMRLARA